MLQWHPGGEGAQRKCAPKKTKVVLITVEVGQGIGNISMEWKFNVFKLVYSRYVGAGAWSMKELSKGRPNTTVEGMQKCNGRSKCQRPDGGCMS